MFNAVLLSLSDGQSYENVQVCEDGDMDKYGIPKIFEEWTGCFFADGKCIVVHHWKIKVIQIDKLQRSGKGSLYTERLVLDGDILYAPATIISHEVCHTLGVPHFFVKRGGIAGQLTWSCPHGTFITHDTNVVSIIVNDPRPKGITRAHQPGVDSITPTQVIRAANAPETVHGKLAPRKSRFS